MRKLKKNVVFILTKIGMGYTPMQFKGEDILAIIDPKSKDGKQIFDTEQVHLYVQDIKAMPEIKPVERTPEDLLGFYKKERERLNLIIEGLETALKQGAEKEDVPKDS